MRPQFHSHATLFPFVSLPLLKIRHLPVYSQDRGRPHRVGLCLDEGRGLAAEDPYVRVRWLLPHQTRQKAVIPGISASQQSAWLMMEPSNRERFLAVREDRKLTSRGFGVVATMTLSSAHLRVYVLYQREKQTVGDVWRQVHSLGNDFSLPLASV